MMSLGAGTKLGRYKIRSKIGEGGMGEVYLAEDTGLHRKVALKILPLELAGNKDRMRRFEQEAQAAAALNHPNIAHIYEIGSAPGSRSTVREGVELATPGEEIHFIAMEYVEGATLREAIHRDKIELRKLLRYLQQVAEGLAKAHFSGIVHRDLKPDNVMITRDGYAKILDFGLAKLTEPLTPSQAIGAQEEVPTAVMQRPQSTPGLVMGTVGYMSPEQAQGRLVDHRSDIFSFGCLLYEAATGQRAFETESTIDTLHKIIHAPVSLVRDVNPAAPPDLTRIVRRCLAKDPDDRYQSVKEAAIELRDVRRELQDAEEFDTTVPPSSVSSAVSSNTTGAATVSGKTVSTEPPSSAEYIVTGIKRHKLTAGLVVLALVIGAIGLRWYLRARDTEVEIDSIAVLPFENQNSDPNSDYLSDGLTESIINSLAQLPGLRVSPRTSVFRYKGKDTDPLKIGQELSVRAVLTGRLLQRGDNLIVSAELLDVRDNKQLWGQQYNRKLADALAVQQEISREISERLRTQLSGEEQKQLMRRDTTNPEAYSYYLKGRYYWNKRTAENVRKAIEQFQQAADKDPNYALAYVGLADCYIVLGDYTGTPTSEALPRAKAFADRALQLDGSLAEAHATLAFSDAQLWQWQDADEEFKRAIKLNPNYPTVHHWYSIYLFQVGRFDEGLKEVQRAQELDPVSAIIAFNGAAGYLNLGNLSSATEQARKLTELDPSFSRGPDILGLIHLKQGRYQEAITELERAVAMSSRRDRQNLRDLGYGYAVAGKRSEALSMLAEIRANYDAHQALGQDIAAVYAGLGDKDQAFAWLEKDFQARDGRLPRIRYLVPFEPLRNDPRYADLLRRMGLQP